MVIVGGAALKGGHGAALKLAKTLKLVRALEEGRVWNGLNVVHMGAARMGGLMLGYAQKGGNADVIAAELKLVLFLGADDAAFSKFEKSFRVFIGHHEIGRASGRERVCKNAEIQGVAVCIKKNK